MSSEASAKNRSDVFVARVPSRAVMSDAAPNSPRYNL
jgi:hypothetical protein